MTTLQNIDFDNYEDLFARLLRADKGDENPFLLAGSTMLWTQRKRQIKAAMQARVDRQNIPYFLGWYAGPGLVGYWVYRGTTEYDMMRKTQFDVDADMGIFPESRKYGKGG